MTSTESFRNQWASQDNLIKKKNLKNQKDAKIKQVVNAFISDFFKEKGRYAVTSELIDNLKDKIDVKTLTTIIEEINRETERAAMANVELPV